MLNLEDKNELVDATVQGNDSFVEKGDRRMERIDKMDELIKDVAQELRKLIEKREETELELKYYSDLDSEDVEEECDERLWQLVEDGTERLYWSGENGSEWHRGPSSSDNCLRAGKKYYRKGDYISKNITWDVDVWDEDGVLSVYLTTSFEYVFRNIFDDGIRWYEESDPVSESFYERVKADFLKEAKRREESNEPPAWLEGFKTGEECLECWIERMDDEEYCAWISDCKNYIKLRMRLAYWEMENGRPATDEEAWHIWNKEFKEGA